MRLLIVEPADRTIVVVEGDPQEQIARQVENPPAIVRLTRDIAIVCCTVGAIGNNRNLWWSRSLQEPFGGPAVIVGIRDNDELTGVPEGAWWMVRKDIVFVGTGDEGREAIALLVDLVLKGKPP